MRPLHFLQLERPDLAGSAIKGLEGAAAGEGAASRSSMRSVAELSVNRLSILAAHPDSSPNFASVTHISINAYR